jgi:hypothetical protein
MANLDDSFLAWLRELSGPLTPHQSRLVLTALIDLLRLESRDVRKVTHGFFNKFWNTTYLTGMENLSRSRNMPAAHSAAAGPLSRWTNSVLITTQCSCGPIGSLRQTRRSLSFAEPWVTRSKSA